MNSQSLADRADRSLAPSKAARIGVGPNLHDQHGRRGLWPIIAAGYVSTAHVHPLRLSRQVFEAHRDEARSVSDIRTSGNHRRIDPGRLPLFGNENSTRRLLNFDPRFQTTLQAVRLEGDQDLDPPHRRMPSDQSQAAVCREAAIIVAKPEGKPYGRGQPYERANRLRPCGLPGMRLHPTPDVPAALRDVVDGAHVADAATIPARAA